MILYDNVIIIVYNLFYQGWGAEKMGTSPLNSVLYDELLKAGRSILELQVGIVSKVNDRNYELIAIDDIANEFKVGDVLDLGETYCRDVVNQGKTIALTEIKGQPGLQRHPLYAARALEAYIGVPIFVDGAVWGTVNFSSMALRPKEFSSAETALVEAYAGLISESIKH